MFAWYCQYKTIVYTFELNQKAIHKIKINDIEKLKIKKKITMALVNFKKIKIFYVYMMRKYKYHKLERIILYKILLIGFIIQIQIKLPKVKKYS